MRSVALGLLCALAGACSDGDSVGSDSGGSGIIVPDDLNALTRNQTPSKRSEMRTAVHPATNSILIFGGNDGLVVNQIPSAARYLDDTWLFEPGTGWTEIEVRNQRPASPRAHAMPWPSIEDGGRALLFGGRFRAGAGQRPATTPSSTTCGSSIS